MPPRPKSPNSTFTFNATMAGSLGILAGIMPWATIGLIGIPGGAIQPTLALALSAAALVLGIAASMMKQVAPSWVGLLALVCGVGTAGVAAWYLAGGPEMHGLGALTGGAADVSSRMSANMELGAGVFLAFGAGAWMLISGVIALKRAGAPAPEAAPTA